MKDIPIFPTDTGVASLILREIPYRQEAYIRVLEAEPGGLEPLLEECRRFCRMAGAEKIYAAGHPDLEEYPLHAAVWALRRDAPADPDRSCHLFPVTQATVGQWRRLYNEKMHQVDNCATLETRDEKQLLEAPGAYFVHDHGELLGIGWLEGTKLLAMAAAKPGAGERVMHTLLTLTQGEMTLEVVSTNRRALTLYDRLGFLKTQELRRWYRV